MRVFWQDLRRRQLFAARAALVQLDSGEHALSYGRRSGWISQRRVPFDSSKITSSMRLPVSTSAVAMMVSEPPSSTLRAAPKSAWGALQVR